jgi:hypothetical protein
MVEVSSPPGLDANLITVFQREFERAWDDAKPTSFLGTVGWNLRKLWQWYCLGVSLLLAFALAKAGKNTWAGLFLSAAATFLVNASASSFQSFRLLVRELRGSR